MNFENMMDEIETYFGEYDENVKPYVLRWLMKAKDENKASLIFDLITEHCKINFGAPDIASIKEAIKQGMEEGKCSDLHKPTESTYIAPVIPEDEEIIEFENEGDLFNKILDTFVHKEAE